MATPLRIESAGLDASAYSRKADDAWNRARSYETGGAQQVQHTVRKLHADDPYTRTGRFAAYDGPVRHRNL